MAVWLAVGLTGRDSAATVLPAALLLSLVLSSLALQPTPTPTPTPRRPGKAGKGGRRWKEGDVRLVRGRFRSAGTVLLYHRGKWGSVCDDGWSDTNSDVVCRQRGFAGSLRTPLKMEFGGRGKSRIWITRVQCRGHEKRLLDCDYVGWGRSIRHMCPGRWRAVGVVCHPKPGRKKGAKKRHGKASSQRRRRKGLTRLSRARKGLTRLSRARKAAAAAAARRKKKMLRQKKTPKTPPAARTTGNPFDVRTRTFLHHAENPERTASPGVSKTPSASLKTTQGPVTLSPSLDKESVPEHPARSSLSGAESKTGPSPLRPFAMYADLADLSADTSRERADGRAPLGSAKVTSAKDVPPSTAAVTSSSQPATGRLSAMPTTSTSTSATTTATSSTTTSSTTTTAPSTTTATPLTTAAATSTTTTSSSTTTTTPSTITTTSTTTTTTAHPSTTVTTFSSTVAAAASTTTANSTTADDTTATTPTAASETTPTERPPPTTTTTAAGIQTTPTQERMTTTPTISTPAPPTTRTTPTTTTTEEIISTRTSSPQTTSTETVTTTTTTVPEISVTEVIPTAETGHEHTSAAEMTSPSIPATTVGRQTTMTSPGDDVEEREDAGDVSESVQSDSPESPPLELQLTGGRYRWEGRLEVREGGASPGPWGAVCGNLWGLREAMVVCREMGHHYAKQALKRNYFGGRVRDFVIYAFNCTGRESTLSDCPRFPVTANRTCPLANMVAGVTCATYLPDLVPDTERLELSVRLQDRPLYYLQCALEENCLSSSAYAIRSNSSDWRRAVRRLLRFSTVVHNRGDADFKPNVAKSNWQWHTCHMHFHSMEVFAHYDILDGDGRRLAEGSKASFCLEDTTCDRGVSRTYDCEGFGDQGLSVNCSDNYLWDIDCQWIDITDIQPGLYTFLLEVNPQMLVAEKDFDNNVVHCLLWYSGYEAKLRDCRHQSLLDYRR